MSSVLTVDVEDWFHADNLRRVVPRQRWGDQEARVVENTLTLLEILDKGDARGTFFVLGWVAERFPDLVKEIEARGHEIASHGYGHYLVHEQERDAFREDIHRAKKLLDDLSQQPVRGYRAPSFSITDWAIEILEEVGYTYDSSFHPSMYHDRYGAIGDADPTNPRPHQVGEKLIEVPVSVLRAGPLRLPWAGGGYFRVYPFWLFRRGARSIADSEDGFLFYIHPWELDPDQPRQDQLETLRKLRHYTNLDKTEERLLSMVSEFEFVPIREKLSRTDSQAV
jgi:polysaccharide deacetylase family protein (PEP-CTERM system associated)